MSDYETKSDDWNKSQLEKAINELSVMGIFQGARLEGRVSWALKNAVLIGQVRESIDKTSFRWIVAGENVPTDHVDGHSADNPRDALRHFCLKWQLGADQVIQASENDPVSGEKYRAKASGLQKQAEDLYEIVESDTFWP